MCSQLQNHCNRNFLGDSSCSLLNWGKPHGEPLLGAGVRALRWWGVCSAVREHSFLLWGQGVKYEERWEIAFCKLARGRYSSSHLTGQRSRAEVPSGGCLFPRAHLAVSGDVYTCHLSQGRCGHLMSRGQGSSLAPYNAWGNPHRNDLPPSVNSGEVTKTLL